MHSCKLVAFLVLSRGQGTNMFFFSLVHFTNVILSKYPRAFQANTVYLPTHLHKTEIIL